VRIFTGRSAAASRLRTVSRHIGWRVRLPERFVCVAQHFAEAGERAAAKSAVPPSASAESPPRAANVNANANANAKFELRSRFVTSFWCVDYRSSALVRRRHRFLRRNVLCIHSKISSANGAPPSSAPRSVCGPSSSIRVNCWGRSRAVNIVKSSERSSAAAAGCHARALRNSCPARGLNSAILALPPRAAWQTNQ